MSAKAEKAKINAGAGKSDGKAAKIPAASAETKMNFLFFKNKEDAMKKAKIKSGAALQKTKRGVIEICARKTRKNKVRS